MQIILPEKVAGNEVYLKTYSHPRSGRLAKFIVSDEGVYEITRIGSASRSALVHNQMKKDGSVHVATPIHPVFMIIGSLFENQSNALPLDILLELGASDGTDNFPTELAEKYASSICSTESGLYKLDLERLKVFLDRYVDGLQPVVPEAIRSQVLRCIQPIDPRESPTPELVDLAEKYAAVQFVTSSWLSPPIAEWYFAKYDFSQLDSTAAELHRLHAEAQAHQFAQLAYEPPKAGRVKSAPAASKTKKRTRQQEAPTKNNSILDMFQKQPKKTHSGP